MRYLIYTIIVAIDLYAIFLHTPSHKTLQVKAPLLDTHYEAMMALEYLNRLRTHAGMAPYASGRILTQAAQNHADYLVRHHQKGHFETPHTSGFTGKLPVERVISAGYKVAFVTENVTNNSLDYKDAVDSLFSAIYHRFGFLDFQSDEIGIGVAQDRQDTDFNAYVFDAGMHALNAACGDKSYNGNERYAFKVCVDPAHRILERRLLEILNSQKIASKKIVLYPYDGQQDVPPVFYDEAPDPLPDYEVSGFPVTIAFNDYYIRQANVRSISLYGPDGREIPSKILYWKNDPNHMLKKNQYALMPLTRLSYGTTYRAELRYEHGGKRVIKKWTFRTRELPKPHFVITQKGQSVTIEPHTTYTLYFPPKNRHDRLGDLHFPADLKVRFLDFNTVQIRLDSDNTDPFTFKSDAHEVKITVRREPKKS